MVKRIVKEKGVKKMEKSKSTTDYSTSNNKNCNFNSEKMEKNAYPHSQQHRRKGLVATISESCFV
jgi:hypothetical protein